MTTQNKATHTAGPWKIMPCPQHAGKHPFHDSRWIATEGAVPEFGHDPRSWTLESGSLICEMRDGDIEANARLIAAAPDLLQALQWASGIVNDYWHANTTEEKNHYAADMQSAIDTMAKAIQRATQP